MLEEFLKKHRIELRQEVLDLCEKGMEFMSKSRDPCHSDVHVKDLISTLDLFLEKESLTNINYEVLLPAIIWHDCWISRQKRTISVLKFVYYLCYEGIGSARMFKKYTKGMDFDPKLLKNIRYCILHHAILSRHRLRLLEARVLKDLDILDTWSFRRQEQYKGIYCDEYGFFKSFKVFRFSRWGYKQLAKRIEKFNFKWCAKEFNKRKENLIREARRLIRINS